MTERSTRRSVLTGASALALVAPLFGLAACGRKEEAPTPAAPSC